MITVEEALQLIRDHIPDFGTAKAPLTSATGATVAADILADREYPPFDRVMMDGIAVSFSSWEEGNRSFRIAGVAPAGEPEKMLTHPAECLEVMTGAPLPRNADLVIPYEHLRIENGVAVIAQDVPRMKFENIHARGSDTASGEVLLRPGHALHGPHTGIAASVGAADVEVKRKPRIDIISTGDELVEIDDDPLPHQIRRSNAHALKSSLALFGYGDSVLSHLPDEPKAVARHYETAAQDFDILLYSGGVSKGKFDYLPSVWKDSGVRQVFHGVSQRPGKPMWFGIDDKRKTVVLGLPGNPVSSLVCLHRYFLQEKDIWAELTEEIAFKNKLTFFVPVRITFAPSGKLLASPLKVKNSGEFPALAGSDGFIELPKDQDVFASGSAFRFFPWRPW